MLRQNLRQDFVLEVKNNDSWHIHNCDLRCLLSAQVCLRLKWLEYWVRETESSRGFSFNVTCILIVGEHFIHHRTLFLLLEYLSFFFTTIHNFFCFFESMRSFSFFWRIALWESTTASRFILSMYTDCLVHFQHKHTAYLNLTQIQCFSGLPVRGLCFAIA